MVGPGLIGVKGVRVLIGANMGFGAQGVKVCQKNCGCSPPEATASAGLAAISPKSKAQNPKTRKTQTPKPHNPKPYTSIPKREVS